jgi:hypothetical protein
MPLWLGISLLVLGLMIGWTLREWWVVGRLERGIIKSQTEAKKFEEFAAEMRRIDSLLTASDALSDLDLLTRLEEKRYGDVSTLLIHKLSLFYHHWNPKPANAASSEIQNALAQIREAAKEFKSVEAVLTHKSNIERPKA